MFLLKPVITVFLKKYIKDIIFSICHVIFQDHMVKDLWNFMGHGKLTRFCSHRNCGIGHMMLLAV